MLVSTTDSLPGYAIVSAIGFVDGSAICASESSSISGDGWVRGKKIVLDTKKSAESHKNVMADCVTDAIDDMKDRAKEMGADAIIGMQVSSFRGSEIHLAGRITEAILTMYVCGLAVRAQRLARPVPANPSNG